MIISYDHIIPRIIFDVIKTDIFVLHSAAMAMLAMNIAIIMINTFFFS